MCRRVSSVILPSRSRMWMNFRSAAISSRVKSVPAAESDRAHPGRANWAIGWRGFRAARAKAGSLSSDMSRCSVIVCRAISAQHPGPRAAPRFRIRARRPLAAAGLRDASQRTTAGSQSEPDQRDENDAKGNEQDQVAGRKWAAVAVRKEAPTPPPAKPRRARLQRRSRTPFAIAATDRAGARRLINLGRKIAGKIQAKRAITIIRETRATAIRMSPSGKAFDFSINVRI